MSSKISVAHGTILINGCPTSKTLLSLAIFKMKIVTLKLSWKTPYNYNNNCRPRCSPECL